MTASHGMFSFPFFSGTRNEKALSDKANYLPTKPAVTQIPLFNNFNKMKRKRSDSSPVSPRLDSPVPKRRMETLSHVQIPVLDSQPAVPPVHETQRTGEKPQDPSEAAPLEDSNGGWDGGSETTQNQDESNHVISTDNSSLEHPQYAARIAGSMVDTSALRQTIEAQFGLEILLKHKELRLIDQEFAKCQAALEQLRRCQIIPYPAMSSDFEAMQAASSGTGSTFNNRAPHAAPWGVADGPYSRHYERWLIPESIFDENVPENVQTPSYAGKSLSDRATRGSKTEAGAVGSLSRSQRGSNNARLKALPHGYPEPKEEKGPMIVKRGSDGKMVKLVCLDCRRSNFNSAQGFINHCRIAHSRQFLSHDTAIEASGEEIDVDAEGIVGEVTHGSQATASSALVHPLIRSATQLAKTPSTSSMSQSSKRKKSQASVSDSNQTSNQPSKAISNPPNMSTPRQQNLATSVPQAGTASFTPSPQTPHLSALLARLGRGGDLEEMVNDAKARPDIDLTLLSDDEDEEAMEAAAGTTSAPQSHSTRGVLRGGDVSSRRSKSPEQRPRHHAFSNGVQKPPHLADINVHQACPSPYHSDEAQVDQDTSVRESNTPFNLSPNTIESHTAPSLVSDDGDYENTHSESDSPSSAEADDDEDHYIHAEVVGHDDMDLGEGSSAEHDLSLGGKPHGPGAGRTSSAMRPPVAFPRGEPESRHVSFANSARRGPRTKEEK